MDVRRMKVVMTGYYDVDMDYAERDYDTTDPGEMLKIDKDNFTEMPDRVLECLDDVVSIEVTWDN